VRQKPTGWTRQPKSKRGGLYRSVRHGEKIEFKHERKRTTV
jgi:hypothetical protein